MDYAKRIIAVELVLICLFSILLIWPSISSTDFSFITGFAVQASTDKQDIQNKIEETIPKLDFINDAGDFSMCLIVPANSVTRYSYDIVKYGSTVVVTGSDSELCKGTLNEDFIIAYVSREKFEEQFSSAQSFSDFKNTADGTNFYIYPSKQIGTGMKLNDPSTFNNRFGDFLKKYFSSKEIKNMLNPAESRIAASFTSYIFYIIVGLIVVVILISVFLVKFSKKPEIKEELEITAYIKSSLSQGYTEEQVRQALLQSGWSESEVQEAFKSVNSGVPAQTP